MTNPVTNKEILEAAMRDAKAGKDRLTRAQVAESKFTLDLTAEATKAKSVRDLSGIKDTFKRKEAIQAERTRLLETEPWKSENAEIQAELTAAKAAHKPMDSEVAKKLARQKSEQSGVAPPEPDKLLSEKKLFQEQCFLINNAEPIAAYHNMRMRNDTAEQHHTAVMAKNPYEILGVWDRVENVHLLSKLTPAQKAVLVPKIKVYKVFFNVGPAQGAGTRLQHARGRAIREIPIVFDDHTKDSDIKRITESHKGRMSGIGITYFRLKERALNEAEIDKNMKCKIGIRAQSMDEFLPSTPADKKALGSRAKFADFWYKNPDSQIKVALGWQIPASVPEDLISKELRNAILSCTRVIYLNLETYDLTFNEDGTVLFEGSYRSNSEAFLDDPGFNVFYLDPYTYSDGSCKDSRDIATQIDGYETRIEILRKTISLRAAAQKSLGNSDAVFNTGISLEGGEDPTEKITDDADRAKLKDIGFSEKALNMMTYLDLRRIQSKENLEKIDEELSSLVAEKNLFVNQYKYHRWSHLLTYLRKESKVYTVGADINTSAKAGKTEPHFKLVMGRGTPSPAGARASQSFDSLKESIRKYITEKEQDNFQAALEGIVVNNTRYTRSDPKWAAPHKTIAFIYFGDLVDAAVKTVKQNPKYNETRTEVDIVLGPAIVYDERGQRTIVNLSDIPISLTLFQSFMLKRYISLDRGIDENVTLHQFISDCMQYLLRDSIEGCISSLQSAMNRKQYLAFGNTMIRGYETGRKTLITKEALALPHGYLNFDHPDLYFGDTPIKDHIRKSFAGNKTPLEEVPISSVRFHMLYHMVDAIFAGSSKEQVSQDKALGVYRFLLGSDKGLMKKVTFTPTDIQYQAESNQLEKNVSANKRYKRLYRANISSIGNTIFRPSSKVFIDPSFVGSSRNASGDFGLDGYYFIEEVDHIYGRDTYETNIHCNWSAPSRPPSRDRKNPIISKPVFPSFYECNGSTNAREC